MGWMGIAAEIGLLAFGLAIAGDWVAHRRGSPARELFRGSSGHRPGALVAAGAAAFPALLLILASGVTLAQRIAPSIPWSLSHETILALGVATGLASYATYTRTAQVFRAGHSEEDGLDPLTRVAGHRTFQDRLSHECDRAFRFGDSFALLLLDLDQFHGINNRHRHSTGDHVLREVAGRLSSAVRDIDLCARFGGDQFAVILPHTLHKGGIDAAERLRRMVASVTFSAPEGSMARVTATVGVAYYPTDGDTPARLVSEAKLAVAFAKSLGGNQIQLVQGLPEPTAKMGNVFHLSASSRAAVVRSLAAAVDVRDRYTHSHSRFVSDLAAATARRVGLPEVEVERVQVGALLHDVGKIGVPDTVLSKQSALSTEDWASIHAHPTLGKTILEQAPELREVVPLVLHHQERFDGSGYPGRLKGEAIPLGARIIAATDAYHAIRSDRPYRSGRSHSEAVLELQRYAGTQFDPSVVKAFISLVETDPSARRIIASLDEDEGAQPYTGRSSARVLANDGSA
ncbi:MAG: diguanylate cyclase [Actinobacteria bacterium]|nr:diguanylate cyclase [Actinomycetota bacterium]